jgi:hypothetical protein
LNRRERRVTDLEPAARLFSDSGKSSANGVHRHCNLIRPLTAVNQTSDSTPYYNVKIGAGVSTANKSNKSHVKMSNHQEQMLTLLEAYLERVTELKSRFADFVVSNDVQRFVCARASLPLLIVVADNPGEKERLFCEFLSSHGSAGRIARCLLGAVFGDDFLARVLILNKSKYSTPRTDDLTKLLTNDKTNAELASEITSDQELNGRLVRQLATQLQIPVVTFGWESDSNTFQAFRRGHGQLEAYVRFRGLTVQQSQIVPHASFRRCYRPMGGDSDRAQVWNSRLIRFLERHKDVAGLRTGSGAISEKTLRKTNNSDLWMSYFTMVVLGAN